MNEHRRPVRTRRTWVRAHLPLNRGAVLIVGLIVLVVMTLLGISGMRTATLQELMARHAKDRNSAFQAAEAGMQAALSYLATLRVPPVVDATGQGPLRPGCQVSDWDPRSCPSGSVHPCCFLASVIDAWEHYPDAQTTELAGQTLAVFSGAGLDKIPDTNQPHFVIESRFVPDQPTFEYDSQRRGTYYFTVAAVGFDPATNSRAILQTTITKSFP